MKKIRKSNENEMVLNFLLGEISSNRFSDDLKRVLSELNLDKSIIEDANLSNNNENLLRIKILSKFRGYNLNSDLFENFPFIEDYMLCEFNQDDLKNIFYMNYSYWNELSSGTSSPLDAAININNNKIVYDVSNEQYIACAKKIQEGLTFTPLIFLTHNDKDFIIVEGHLRMTAYALVPQYCNNVKAIVLKCSKEDLETWNN